MAWTTTPWTLPANVAVAVNPKIKYVKVDYKGRKLILAKGLVEKVFTDEKHQPLDYKIVEEIKGSELVGKKYQPLFENHGPRAHVIVEGDFVTELCTRIFELVDIDCDLAFSIRKLAGVQSEQVDFLLVEFVEGLNLDPNICIGAGPQLEGGIQHAFGITDLRQVLDMVDEILREAG